MPVSRPSMLDDRRSGRPTQFTDSLQRDIHAGLRALDVEEQERVEVLTGKRLQQRAPQEQPNEEDSLTLTALVPNTVALGQPSFTLSVMGTGFKEDSVILWNGSAEPTTFVSDTEVTTGVNMDTAVAAVGVLVAVQNADGTVSEELVFTFTA